MVNKKEQTTFENHSADKEVKVDLQPIDNLQPIEKTKSEKQIIDEENKTKNQKPLLYGRLLKINKRK